ncbi:MULTISPECIES: PepSY domain-containing protein, partial [Ectothiorhodospira]|uniref:PepSY domain-containing protein n=1 Tax=Ectothiorhodospira TaxID=1051 RepID=UPI0004A45A13
MLRTLWFQLHWFMGITVGVVLIILGVTGGMLTFEREIIRAINSDVLRVEPLDTQRLSPEALLRQAQEVLPERQINALRLSSDPRDAATVNVAGDGPQARRGVNHYFNPYTGELIGAELKGQAFFRTLQRLHRWLLMGDVGKQITGAATIMLMILVLSGIYLRWPRSWKALAGWFTFSFRRSGRGFVSSMHGVVGTWVLPLYLLAALTGLYWSYDWYRAGLHELSGVPMPVRQAPPQRTQEGDTGGRAGEEAPGDRLDQVNAIWQTFEQVAPLGYSTATLRLPQPGGDYQFMYFDPRPAHERAWNRLTLAAGTGDVQNHVRYADRPLNEKLMSSMLPLHSGSFFGMPGRIAMMVASLIMPLFAITGLVLYIDRRRKAQVARSALLQAGLKPSGDSSGGEGERIHVVFASQTGNAQTQAWKTAEALQAAGLAVAVHPLGTLTPNDLKDMGRVLFIASTFGEGEAPAPARPFVSLMERQCPDLSTLEYALLALGDRGYPHFCAFGRDLDVWLRSCGAKALVSRIEMDGNRPEAALAQWQDLLPSMALSGGSHQKAPSEA